MNLGEAEEKQKPVKVLISKPMSFPKNFEFPEGSHLLMEENRLSRDFERKWPKIGGRLGRIYLARELFKRRRDFDLIITGRYGEYFALLQGLLRCRRKAHLLLDIEWYEKRKSRLLTLVKKIMNRLIARGAYRIGVFTEVEIENYSNYYRIDKNKFIWVPYCMDLSGGEFDLKLKEENYIFTGGLHHRDYETLYHAVKDICIDIMIAAPLDGVDKKFVSKNMLLVGVINSNSYYSAMAKSKLVVLSLETDLRRCPGVITYVSAMWLGKPVIVNETKGTRSYIVNGKTGLIIPPRDPFALKNAIERLLCDDDLRKEISRNAYQHARENFSTDRLMKELRRWTVE